MTMEQTRVRLANGIELDVVDEGPKDAPALIFLHGFPESHRTWRHQIPYFSDRFRCIAPDQRGYCGSSKPQEVSAYSPDKLVGDIFQLADALGVETFTIVGHDWGGAIAWGVALGGQMNGRVTRCVIANAPHPAIFQKLLFTDPNQRESSQYIRGFRDTANDDLVREHGLVGILMKEVRWDRPDAMEAEEREALLKDWQDRDAAFGMLNWYRASPMIVPPMDAPFEVPADYQPPQLPNLSIPTLVIWAMDDLALPPGNMVGMDEIIDDLTIEKVTGCGHFVPWESPAKVNAAMDAFLGRTA
ncbi:MULTISPECIES: alpha/beta fold hydrolase [Citromicrobium]|uniref:alpha/beta fold hydrolase n=1 Tax=Citromicrobium TaxID=72173 RepID=UPI0001DD062B|nr:MULTISPECIES: alpha/beta hydrolase [Citromicrobium]ALG60852.1 alpha/beta hydrolase [Citromicrobium sp. JL477]KPM13381.1 alpha/beta hydrolase [Citromicrobium sp. JL1351]KPM14805.1 alpha/beta hydrolase [Citromicrobium sp. JL31]KPM15654.1 alpha/beta hydrolase [Citromicrobium sp. WPS32]KPM22301.1 alpha/beta hydrolase [Citromicrobium sp. JL2201]|tara:strand:+ start:1301 stop:2203 length:903 start_codon:yes stop_codon:yes gene_type:complete